jgi:hypothetical protein
MTLPPTELTAETSDRPIDIVFAYSLLENLHGQVRIADEKIRGLFSGSALLAAALAVNSGLSLRSMGADGLTVGEQLLIAVRGLLLIAVASALLAAIVALLPRIVPRRSLRSLFFFGHIASTEHDQFLKEFAALGRQAALEQIMSQIHVNSVIVQAKYVWTRRAAGAFMVAILIWIAVQMIEFAL